MKTIEAMHHHVGKETCAEENPSDARITAVMMAFLCSEIDKLKERLTNANREQID